jgi:hypothetical protein
VTFSQHCRSANASLSSFGTSPTLDYRTIARIADVKTGTVSATLNAAHDSLRASLKEELHA